jgi:TsgA-like MFS transporter
MRFNKVALTLVAFVTYMIMSGLLTQIGVIISPLSEYLGISITAAASMFSLLTGGTFAGTFVSMLLYNRFPIQQVLKYNYAIYIGLLVLLVTLDIRIKWLVSVYLFCLGIGCGIGLAGGAVLIARLYNEQKRASAFLATDCSFSLAGYLFPSLAVILLAANLVWTVSFATVGILALFIIIACFSLTFPEHTAEDKQTPQNSNDLTGVPVKIWTPRVLIMAFGLCCYLTTQTTFLTWAPSYLQQTYGLDQDIAGKAVGNYWGPSIFGLLAVTFLVTKVPTRPLLLVVTISAVVIAVMLQNTQDADWFLTVTLALGFLTSCTFKLAISIGSQQIDNAPPTLVTFLLCSATIGSTVAPALSAFVVSLFGVGSAMLMTVIGYVVVALLFATCLLLENRVKRPANEA